MTAVKKPRLILRTVRSDMTSHGGFIWPTQGKVTAPDWNPKPECGGGLHGLLNGQGDASLLSWSPDAKWIVAQPGRLLADLGGKVKCKTATVVYCGDRAGAIVALRTAGVTDPLPGDAVAAGYYGQATAGYCGQATAGDYGQATAGHYGQATAGYGGQATAGDHGQATAGDHGMISVSWFDGFCRRLAVGYVGEDGIKPNVAYRCDDSGNLIEVAP